MIETVKHSPSLPPLLPRVSDYVSWHANRTPDAEAMVLNKERISYSELNVQVNRLAKSLINAGVQKGDRVATLCTPSPDYFVTFLAATSIGAIWIGLNPRYTLEELSYVTNDSAPVILFSRSQIGSRDYQPDIDTLVKQSQSIHQIVLLDIDDHEVETPNLNYNSFTSGAENVSDDVLSAAREQCGGRDPCMIVYTSGSTGKPKGALLHHQGIAQFSLRQNKVWPVSPLRSLNYFPINHIGCVLDMSMPTLVAGGTTIFLENFTPLKSLELMEREKITQWGSVPSAFQLQFAEESFDTFDLSAVQLILWEGAAMPRDMIARLLEYNVPLASNYGMTESGSAITVMPPSRDIDTLEKTVGWPFEGVEVRLVDTNGDVVADGDTGEIETRSVHNMLGYWNNPEATANTLSEDGWLSTGDLGRCNPDGSYSIVGRVKEMYKSGGYNVYPREVEGVIEDHPAVELAAVVSTEDPIWQEIGIAYVCTSASLSESELEGHCRRHLANYKIPKAFVFMEALPLLPIGKVDKVSLKARAAEDYRP